MASEFSIRWSVTYGLPAETESGSSQTLINPDIMLGASAGDWCGSSRFIPFGRPVVRDEYAAMHGGTKSLGKHC